VDWLNALRTAFGDGWLFGIAVVIYLVANSAVIPKWFGERRLTQTSERERLSEDQRALIESYEREADNQRRWRAEDAERDARRIAGLEDRLARQEQVVENMAEAAVSSERGNARLRHLSVNLFQHIAAQRDLERRRGLTPLPFDGWREALNISDDLDEKLHALFDETARPPAGC
jgi:uncharacterized coiled-coil protein SlyX